MFFCLFCLGLSFVECVVEEGVGIVWCGEYVEWVDKLVVEVVMIMKDVVENLVECFVLILCGRFWKLVLWRGSIDELVSEWVWIWVSVFFCVLSFVVWSMRGICFELLEFGGGFVLCVLSWRLLMVCVYGLVIECFWEWCWLWVCR